MTSKRLLFVQFGDYSEAYQRFEEGGAETFYAQRYSVDFVGELPGRPDVEAVAQLCLLRDLEPETLSNGVIQLGVELRPKDGSERMRELLATVRAWKPTHAIVATPMTALIRSLVAAGVDVLPLLADSFQAGGLRPFLRDRWLAHTLCHRAIRWVSNHNVGASRDLARIGVPARKIVPFDWPAIVRPDAFAPKTGPRDTRAPRLLYVGQLLEEKGVGDLIAATAALRAAGRNATLSLIGIGDEAAIDSQIERYGLRDSVRRLGRMPHAEVLSAMQEHDVVVVPSRPDYPEGLPMVIYEALCARTPVVVSSHPMFTGRIRDGEDGLVFKAGDARALEAALSRLLDDAALYARFSRDVEVACARFTVCAIWGEMIEHWLDGGREGDAWLSARSLDAPQFEN